jgi:hypothetical protein
VQNNTIATTTTITLNTMSTANMRVARLVIANGFLYFAEYNCHERIAEKTIIATIAAYPILNVDSAPRNIMYEISRDIDVVSPDVLSHRI